MSEQKKYEILKDQSKTLTFKGKEYTLYRIRALKDNLLHSVKKGTLGGWVEHENILSHEGNAWIANESCVGGKTIVQDDACISGNAMVFGESEIKGSAWVGGSSTVYNTHIHGNAIVSGRATLLAVRLNGSSFYHPLQIGGDVHIQASIIGGSNIVIEGNIHVTESVLYLSHTKILNDAKLFKCRMGLNVIPLEKVVIRDKADLNHVVVDSILENFSISDQVVLTNLKLNGANGTISGHANVSGAVDIYNSEIGEFARVSLHEGYLNLSGERLAGDMVLYDEDISRWRCFLVNETDYVYARTKAEAIKTLQEEIGEEEDCEYELEEIDRDAVVGFGCAGSHYEIYLSEFIMFEDKAHVIDVEL
ncbi:hypothetical protein JMA_37390 (plasmid) [Jeotgalibacillus malaysiensis]|uniref:Uncharacterized protein n=1 Tax=Jeotgalibacillus malaysiensis TaxID=1508404 RepID=A0A0B5AWF4_9BACL|nr:hypothetical protein [Jeotgalibacillus malaysiensis]AJD93057.1 hypothetical protein JMA_37390 [Jeotgalibacillus malaysiensis]